MLAVRVQIILDDIARDQPFSFRLALDGIVTLSVTWPTLLQHDELPTGATIALDAADWVFSRNVLHTKWKSASALASRGALAIHTPAAGPAPDEVIGTTVAALKTRPMAVRMAILRSGKSGRESLYIVGANYSSDVLNAGTTGYDPDDLSMIARVPTLPALVRLVPSKLPDDEQDE